MKTLRRRIKRHTLYRLVKSLMLGANKEDNNDCLPLLWREVGFVSEPMQIKRRISYLQLSFNENLINLVVFETNLYALNKNI